MQLKAGNQSEKVNEKKSWFIKKTNKINKPLTRLPKGGKKKKRHEREDMTTDSSKVKRIKKGYY